MATRKRNVRDLESVIDLVQASDGLPHPEKHELVHQMAELRTQVCCNATDCRLCRATQTCERLLVRAFAGRWECRA